MNNENSILTRTDVVFILVGIMVGSGIVSLPRGMVGAAKQDGWIATFIGCIYPLYIVIASAIINKKHENQTIMELSKIYLGKYIGGVLNFLFMLQFIIYAILVTGANINMVKVYNIWFMKSSQIALVFILLVGYAAYNGIETVAKINRISFYIIIILVLASFSVFRVSKSLINIKPIMQDGIFSLFGGIEESFYNYGNIEIILIISAYAKDKKNVLKDSIIGVLIVAIIYTWVVLITTIYLGPDIVPKYLWPYVITLQAVRISLFSDLKFFLGLLWVIMNFKTAMAEMYASIEIFQNINNKLDKKKIAIVLSSFLFLALIFKNEIVRRKVVGFLIPKITLFNVIYTTLILIMVKLNIKFKKN